MFKYFLIFFTLCSLLLISLSGETWWKRKRLLQTNTKEVLSEMVVNLEKERIDLWEEIGDKDKKIDRLKNRARFGTAVIMIGVFGIIGLVILLAIIIFIKFFK